LERSTSGDERNKQPDTIIEEDEQNDMRFDDKGRPIKGSKYNTMK